MLLSRVIVDKVQTYLKSSGEAISDLNALLSASTPEFDALAALSTSPWILERRSGVLLPLSKPFCDSLSISYLASSVSRVPLFSAFSSDSIAGGSAKGGQRFRYSCNFRISAVNFSIFASNSIAAPPCPSRASVQFIPPLLCPRARSSRAARTSLVAYRLFCGAGRT